MVGHKDLIWTNGKQTFNQIIVILPKNIDYLEKGLINLRSFFFNLKTNHLPVDFRNPLHFDSRKLVNPTNEKKKPLLFRNHISGTEKKNTYILPKIRQLLQ